VKLSSLPSLLCSLLDVLDAASGCRLLTELLIVPFLQCILLSMVSRAFGVVGLIWQVTLGHWTCPNAHVVKYDGGSDGLFSTRKADDSGSVLVFTRSFCDGLVSFIYNSRSSYAAAACFLASLRSAYGLRRQVVVSVGRCFVACLQPTPELFSCPKCGVNPDYIVIDGQALGFRMKEGIKVARPALHLPSMNLNVNKYAVLEEPSVRAAVRKLIRTGDPLNKQDVTALTGLHETIGSVFPRARSASTVLNWRLKRHAAQLLFHFFVWEPTVPPTVGPASRQGAVSATPTSANNGAARGRSGAASRASGGAPLDGQGGIVAAAPSTLPWHSRKGNFRPNLYKSDASSTQWAVVRPFLLAMLGDPVVNLFQGHSTGSVVKLAKEMQKDSGGEWVKLSMAANAAGFVANFFARLRRVMESVHVLRQSVGALLKFSAEVDAVVDRDFKAAARRAAEGGQHETEEFCRRWLGVTTAAEYDTFAAEHPDWKDKDIDSPYTSFEYFGFLKRVRPAIFTPRAKAKKGAERQPRAGRPAKGAQAALEDATDRCSKSFPKHSQLTAGVFNVVCPHVLTMGFRVMFGAESVADALSLILERFPALPKVVFYDVACKMDRNGMQRVRSILSKHKVRFCLDRAHAKGHTFSCVYFPDESLSVTNGVTTQAAEVQHSISVKFRGHLAYMTAASFMAHRIVQLSLMNLTAAFKLQPGAKCENEGVRLNDFYFGCSETKCVRPGCACPPGTTRWALPTNKRVVDDDPAAASSQDDGESEAESESPPSTAGEEDLGMDESMGVGRVKDLGMSLDESLGVGGEEDLGMMLDESMGVGEEDSGMAVDESMAAEGGEARAPVVDGDTA